MPEIHITLTPNDIKKIPDQGFTVVLIDTLRATTTIVAALARGAKEVRNLTNAELGVKLKDETLYLVCGENKGKPIPGFDLGNSPLEYRREVILNKIIFFKTSNGTRVLTKLSPRNKVFIGALVNSAAVVKKIKELNQDVYLVCAGTQGEFSLEDFFTAGCFAFSLFKEGFNGGDLEIAAARIFEHNQSFNEIVNLFFLSRNGHNLIELGYREDVYFASKLDLFNIVPIWKGEKIILD